MDLREIIRYMRAGESDRAIHKTLGVNRRTLQAYRAWASAQGLLTGELPTLEQLQQLREATWATSQPPQNISTVEPYRALVEQLRQAGIEVAAIWQRLRERGYQGSYSSVYRFVQQLEPARPDVTVRVERKPGEEAQLDFGYAGRLIDPTTGEMRKAWAFVMTLAWSRHQYVEFVWDQRLEHWLLCHAHAFAFFGGVPGRLVIDNLKAAITRACWEDPQVQVAYRECAEHYGFLIAPCRPGTPQHKGKVEQGGVHYLKRNFLAGREPQPLPAANQAAREWCLTTAGLRVHGTTQQQPLVQFEQVERAHLQLLPVTPYDLACWKVVKVHRDCYVTFQQAYYSVPFRLVGQQVRVRGGGQQVRIYTLDGQLVATHERGQPGSRQTHLEHLPSEKVPGLLLERGSCREQAQTVGPATQQVVSYLLDDAVVDRLPTAGRLLRLAERYSPSRLEAACARALYFGDPSYPTIKRVLEQALDNAALPAPALNPPASLFLRDAQELVGRLFGGQLWT